MRAHTHNSFLSHPSLLDGSAPCCRLRFSEALSASCNPLSVRIPLVISFFLVEQNSYFFVRTPIFERIELVSSLLFTIFSGIFFHDCVHHWGVIFYDQSSKSKLYIRLPLDDVGVIQRVSYITVVTRT